MSRGWRAIGACMRARRRTSFRRRRPPVVLPTRLSLVGNSPRDATIVEVRATGPRAVCTHSTGATRLALLPCITSSCATILVGSRRQLKPDSVCKDGFVGMLDAEMEKTEVIPVLYLGISNQIFDVEVNGEKVYRDDLTGQMLDPRLVRGARQKELDFF